MSAHNVPRQLDGLEGMAFTWSCTQCGRLLGNEEVIIRRGDFYHWDVLLQDWCGPAQRVGLV